MRHIHTSIVSRHLVTRGNNKILRTPPPHTSSSEEILPRLTRRTLAQLRTNKSPFLKSYLHKVDAKTHPSPLCPLCNIHTHDTHHLFNCTHIRTTLSPLDLWTDPAGVTAQMDGEAGWWTTSGNIGLPPLARAMGVGRQQQQRKYVAMSFPVYGSSTTGPLLDSRCCFIGFQSFVHQLSTFLNKVAFDRLFYRCTSHDVCHSS